MIKYLELINKWTEIFTAIGKNMSTCLNEIQAINAKYEKSSPDTSVQPVSDSSN